MKTCANCNKPLTNKNCYYNSSGYLRAYCKICHNKRSNNYNKISSKALHRKLHKAAKARRDRQIPSKIGRFILRDCKNSDRKRNRNNDLTREFVDNLIKHECTYCGETTLRMTLDRIDNNIGHIQSNCLAACIRCNYARGTMPYEAWLCLVDGMKKARIAGLFKDWTGRKPRNKVT